MKELVAYLAGQLVDHPEEVRVETKELDSTVVYELRVAKEDLGKVIGKQGRTARAMRTLLGAAAAGRENRDVRLEIVE